MGGMEWQQQKVFSQVGSWQSLSVGLSVNRAALFWGVSLEPGNKEDIQKVQIHHILYLYHGLTWNNGINHHPVELLESDSPHGPKSLQEHWQGSVALN